MRCNSPMESWTLPIECNDSPLDKSIESINFLWNIFQWSLFDSIGQPSPSPTTEVRDSRTSRHSAHVQSQFWQIWLVLVSIYCVYKAIQTRNVVGPGQRSRFLVLTKRSSASGDENASRRVENVSLAVLTFCTKREYIPSSSSIKCWYIPLNMKN